MRLKRLASTMIEEAKKVESSLVYSEIRVGKTLDMRDLEPIEGWEYSVDPWPGRAVREMSPLTSIDDDDVEQMEKELIADRKEIQNEQSPVGTGFRGVRGGSRSIARGRQFRGRVR